MFQFLSQVLYMRLVRSLRNSGTMLGIRWQNVIDAKGHLTYHAVISLTSLIHCPVDSHQI